MCVGVGIVEVCGCGNSGGVGIVEVCGCGIMEVCGGDSGSVWVWCVGAG